MHLLPLRVGSPGTQSGRSVRGPTSDVYRFSRARGKTCRHLPSWLPNRAHNFSIIPLERARHMRRSFMLAILFAVGLQLPAGAQPSGWTTLLEGTTLKGWTVVGDANWAAVDGAVQATMGGNSYLVTPNSYGDFQLVAEVWVSAGANSGIFVRCQDPKNITAANAYEVNIYDTRADQTYRTGSIVDVARPIAAVNADGRWTTVDITMRGTKLTVVMNGITTVDVEHTGHARGPVALQYGQGAAMVRFRNVRIRTL